MRRLDPLVGEWRTEALVDDRPAARARTRFEWIQDGAFLFQRTEAEPSDIEVPPDWAENAPFPIVAVFGLDEFSDRFNMLYADGRGVRRVYQMTFVDNEWNIWGRPGPDFYQRFIATLGAAGDVISGRWEKSSDSSSWTKDFDIRYTKVAG